MLLCGAMDLCDQPGPKGGRRWLPAWTVLLVLGAPSSPVHARPGAEKLTIAAPTPKAVPNATPKKKPRRNLPIAFARYTFFGEAAIASSSRSRS